MTERPNVTRTFVLMPEAEDAVKRLAAIAKTSEVNMVNCALMTMEQLIDMGIIPVSALTGALGDGDTT